MSATSITTWHPLSDGYAPDWASGWGEDRWGPFVEITITDVMQRLRWIPAGQFQMGSPEDEPGRVDSEGPQHWVDITRGFWLFDTPVTQELWEAVMGAEKNHSEFRHKHRPVENVSWDDCQVFFERCPEVFPAIELCLPTEAEWEYACRAGTTDATYAGPIEILGDSNAPVLDSIAWYGGNCGVDWDLEEGWETSDWSEKQYELDKGGTGIVGTREPNPWGLYDMLGNVWEWCRDVWKRDYTREEVVDPVHEPDDAASAFRVVRGGSWHYYARIVRAACRGRLSPASRYRDIGFRCRVR